MHFLTRLDTGSDGDEPQAGFHPERGPREEKKGRLGLCSIFIRLYFKILIRILVILKNRNEDESDVGKTTNQKSENAFINALTKSNTSRTSKTHASTRTNAQELNSHELGDGQVLRRRQRNGVALQKGVDQLHEHLQLRGKENGYRVNGDRGDVNIMKKLLLMQELSSNGGFLMKMQMLVIIHLFLW